MRGLWTREALRALDLDASERLGIPGVVLMENAGRGAAQALLERFGPRPGRVVLVGGPGQNGGDAWVVARHLHNLDLQVHPLLVGDPEKVKGDAQLNLRALHALGVAVERVQSEAALDAALAGADLVVDGLFGTGLDRPVCGVFGAAVEAMNRAAAQVVALDLPSGVDADTGAVLGHAVQATLTVTFAAEKRGLFQYPGRGLCGEIRCVSIGVPAVSGASAQLIEPTPGRGPFAPRQRASHKGQAGHVLVVAGAPGTTGAALLAARGAFRAGAGLVTLAPRAEALGSVQGRVLEAMTLALPADLEAALARLHEACPGKASAVVGPGLGVDPVAAELARRLARELPLPLVLDADGLSAHAGQLGALREAAQVRVLTPHPGEAARLLGVTSAEVQADRYAAASRLAHESGQLVVLKGAGTVVATPEGELAVCDAGTPALAVAGTGDVLAGVLAACLANGSKPFAAAQAAVWVHARAGELAAQADRGLLASEVADAVPRAFAEVLQRAAS